MISVVIPVYGAPEILPVLVEKFIENLPDAYEIILIDDDCPQNSWEVIGRLSQENQAIIGIKHKINQGQHIAIWSGLQVAKGDKIIVADCDLQDNPDYIPLFLEYADKHQAVIAIRNNRRDGFFKKQTSVMFWMLLGGFTGLSFHPLAGNFGIYDRELINKICSTTWKFYFFPAMVRKSAGDIYYIPIKHQERPIGKSSYSWYKLMKLGWNVLRFYR